MTTAAEPAAAPVQARLTLLALVAATLPFFFMLPPWVAGGALVLIAWRGLALRGHIQPPGLWIRVLLLLVGLLAVVASFRSFGGATAGGAFLIITVALKALESRTRRDFRIVTLATWFLLAAAFLLNQSLPFALYSVPVVWLATLALLADATQERWKTLAKRAVWLLAAALPLALVLFLLFPRLPGPLFRFGAPHLASVSGLADSLSPGSIGSLTTSNAVAFRVHFDGAVPPPDKRYFRGPVFERYDGERWLPGRSYGGQPHFQIHGKPVHYRVLERANGTHYLFAPTLPVHLSTPANFTARYEMLAPHRIWNDVAYTGVSYLDYTEQTTLSARARAANLALPQGDDPRAHALAVKWRRANSSASEVVQTALAWFHDQPFYYTLSPGRLSGPNRVDQFLFDTRRGFCEHYASAFAVLMRAAGIPARIVTGYAGGAINPYDGWLVLRQSNAHAWDEVWLAGRGWVRVDPTSVIPATRVESSATRTLATSPTASPRFASGGWLWQVRYAWDAVNTVWTEYVVGFDPALQQRLLNQLGLARAGPFAAAVLMVAVVLGAGVLAFLLGLARLKTGSGDPAHTLYLRWCRRLARHGPVRAPGEGPLDFAARVVRESPRHAESAKVVTSLYINVRYAGNAALLPALKRHVQHG
ncbi:MAG: DUF3488 and transglutaminase-like domain-containing protein [Gammaproteobacteria bacterium]